MTQFDRFYVPQSGLSTEWRVGITTVLCVVDEQSESLFACKILLADAEEKIEDGWTWLPAVIGEMICLNIAEAYHP